MCSLKKLSTANPTEISHSVQAAGSITQGEQNGHNICLVCSEVFSDPKFPCSTSTSRNLKLKEKIAEITMIDIIYLSLKEESIGFCASCKPKIDQLQDVFKKFDKLRNSITKLSSEICHAIVKNNCGKLTSEKLDVVKSPEWNMKRVQNMLVGKVVGGINKFQIESLEAEREYIGSNNVLPSVVTDSEDNSLEDADNSPSEKQHKVSNKGASLSHQNISKESYDCPHCSKSYTKAHTLRVHMRTHTNKTAILTEQPERNFKCEQCSKLFARTYSLRIHMKTVHGNQIHSCDKCRKKFTSVNELEAHLKEHEKKAFKCPICGKVLSQKRGLDAHLHCHHLKDFSFSTVSCEICEKSFDSPLTLMAHMNLHKGDFHCPVTSCKVSFESKKLLSNHMKVHEPNSCSFQCDYCSAIFDNQQELKQHSASHLPGKMFLCDQCGRRLPSKSLLSAHLRLHKNSEYICEICDKSFYSSSNLKNHMRSHSGEKPFKCTECEESFLQKTSLIFHARKHSGVMPFTCLHCKHPGFSYKLALRQHMGTKHPDIYLQTKKFLCEVCWRNFAEESDLIDHKGVHDKHKCQLCSRQFKMKMHLKEHLLRHASLKPHKCTMCDKAAFVRKKYLLDHMKKVHPDQDPPAMTETDNVTYVVQFSA